MDKLKLSEWGEMLKTGGAQMSRLVSGKVKEMLQAPTPESKMVDEATLETMGEPNWGLNLRICAMINSQEYNGTEIVKAIKRKFSGKSVVSQRLSLDLLEACTSNCEKVFSEVASEKVLDEMVRMIENPQTDQGNRDRALQLIGAWGESEDLEYLPVFHQTSKSLRGRSLPPPPVEDGSSFPMQYSLESYVHQEPLSPSGSYPIPDMGLHGADHNTLPYNFGGSSIEEKNEMLVTTRNSLELLSSILNAETEPKPIKEDLTVSLLDKCKQSQPDIQRIIESTTDDEVMLFEALNLHDELQRVISQYEELEAGIKSREQLPESSSTGANMLPAQLGHQNETKLADYPIGANMLTAQVGHQNETKIADSTIRANMLPAEIEHHNKTKTADSHEGESTESSSAKKKPASGLTWVSFKTNDSAMISPLAGSTSAIRAMPADVLANAYRISVEEARRIKFGSQETTLVSVRRLQVLSNHGSTYSGYRRFSVFNEFSKKIKGEADRNQEFKQSVKELKEKAEELKGAKEELKVRTKQTTEQLYKHVDGVWTEAEATAKKVSANVKEKISAATEEVKETFGIGKESSESTGTSAKDGAGAKDGTKASPGEEADKQTGNGDTAETLFGKFKSRIPSSNVSSAYKKLKEARVSEMMKKGYDVVKDELYGNTNRRKHLEHTPPPAFSGEISTKTDIVVLPSKQSRWSKKWEAFREKMQGHPIFKRFAGLSEPVVTKGQEESDAAASFKEIRRKDPYDEMSFDFSFHKLMSAFQQLAFDQLFFPLVCFCTRSFSLMDFVAEVQEAVRPVLNAYSKGDIETLKKYCTPEVINRCEAEHKAFQAHGIFFDNKFQTQQVHCVRDQHGAITEGGQDTIHTVYYAWAMRQIDAEELGGGAIYPIWKLMEMQQLGVQTLI
uniref:VHS domain-containing protein n=1 Tax=Salix viminalis TaxID=40686 RepID=A0A6N2L3C9_SALVM